MDNNRNDSKYIFRYGNELFLNMSMFPFVILLLGVVIEIYIKYFQYIYILLIITVLLGAYIITYPSYLKHLYYRWLVFRHNKVTTFSIDTEQKLFIYKHGEEETVFASKDVEKWSFGAYGTWNTTFVEIVRIKLKDGKKIEISSGIGDVNGFLQKNWKRLGLPNGTYRYGDDIKSLQSYIKRIEKR